MATLSENSKTSPYVNLAYKKEIMELHDDRSHSSDDRLVNLNKGVREVRMRKPKSTRQVGTVFFDYTADQNDEISIKRGSVAEIIHDNHEEEGWVIARVRDCQGLIPRCYLSMVGDEPTLADFKEVVNEGVLIGSGGFANVYRGYYKHEPVAIKVPRSNASESTAGLLEALIHEAVLLCRLDHPNVIQFISLSKMPMFLILELCRGGTLFSLCRRMRVAYMPTSVMWTRQIASAMEHLHSQEDPLVHADIKADNVLIKERPCECGVERSRWRLSRDAYKQNGTCMVCAGSRLDYLTMKITDFGLSRTLKAKNFGLSGSSLWLAPEVIRENTYSTYSDIWSFGVFMWEVFSCGIPFSGYNHDAILFAIARGGKTLSLPNDCPKKLSLIFRACWNCDPLLRPNFSRIVEMLDEFEAEMDSSYEWNPANYDDGPKLPLYSTDDMQQLLRTGQIVDRASMKDKATLLPVREAPKIEPRKRRQKRSKSRPKPEIGVPTHFRHKVAMSVTPSNAQAPRELTDLIVSYPQDEDSGDEASKVVSNTQSTHSRGASSESHTEGVEHEDRRQRSKLSAPNLHNAFVAEKFEAVANMSYSRNRPLMNNSAYTHLPSLESESRECENDDNFVFVEFPHQHVRSKSSTATESINAAAGTLNGEAMRNDHRHHYIRLVDDNKVKPTVENEVIQPASNNEMLSHSASMLKSNSNPELANYTILQDDSKEESAKEAATFRQKFTPPLSSRRINRHANYVVLRASIERPRPRLFAENSSDSSQIENFAASSVMNMTNIENNAGSTSSSSKTRSLGRANAIRRKTTSSGLPNANALESAALGSNPGGSTLTVSSSTLDNKTEKIEPEQMLHKNSPTKQEPKESSVSLPNNVTTESTLSISNSVAMSSMPTLKVTPVDDVDNPRICNEAFTTTSDSSPVLKHPYQSSTSSLGTTCKGDDSALSTASMTAVRIAIEVVGPFGASAVASRSKSPSPSRRREKTLSQSTFYVSSADESSYCSDSFNETLLSPESVANSRQSSTGHKKFGSIFSRFSNILSPKSARAADAFATDGSEIGTSPNDGLESTQNFNEVLFSSLSQDRDLHDSKNTSSKAPLNVCSLTTTNLRPFMKLDEYPSRQRQKYRTESAIAAANAICGSTSSLSSAVGHHHRRSRIPSSSERYEPDPNPTTTTAELKDIHERSSQISTTPIKGMPNLRVTHSSGGRSPTSPSLNQPRISIDTVIETQKNLNGNTFQTRPHSTHSSENFISTHHHNDILSRPIQSFNNLSAQQKQQLQKRPKQTDTNLNDEVSFSSSSKSSYSLPKNTHQRSKSSDNKYSVAVNSMIAASDNLVNSNDNHSLRYNASQKSQHNTIHADAPSLGTQIASSRMNNNFVQRDDKNEHHKYSILSNCSKLENNVQFCQNSSSQLPTKSNETKHSNVNNESEAKNNNNEATLSNIASKMTSISNKKSSQKLSDQSVDSKLKGLRMPTSTAPILNMNVYNNKQHSSLVHQVRRVNTPVDTSSQIQRPKTLNLNQNQKRLSNDRRIIHNTDEATTDMLSSASYTPTDSSGSLSKYSNNFINAFTFDDDTVHSSKRNIKEKISREIQTHESIEPTNNILLSAIKLEPPLPVKPIPFASNIQKTNARIITKCNDTNILIKGTPKSQKIFCDNDDFAILNSTTTTFR